MAPFSWCPAAAGLGGRVEWVHWQIEVKRQQDKMPFNFWRKLMTLRKLTQGTEELKWWVFLFLLFYILPYFSQFRKFLSRFLPKYTSTQDPCWNCVMWSAILVFHWILMNCPEFLPENSAIYLGQSSVGAH